jgi:hypothetical protein
MMRINKKTQEEVISSTKRWIVTVHLWFTWQPAFVAKASMLESLKQNSKPDTVTINRKF